MLIHGAWSRGQQWLPAKRAFEERGYTVHTPTLRHHVLEIHEGAPKIASLSLLDYVGDLVALVESLESPPLIVGHSMGGLLAQLVAARTRHVGLIAACPAPVGVRGSNAAGLRITYRYLRQRRQWANAVHLDWELARSRVAQNLPEATAREIYAELVCESSRVLFWELVHPWLDRRKAAAVDFDAIATPVLVFSGEDDRIVRARGVRRLPRRYRNARYVEIAGADHMVFSGATLPVTMGHIDRWIADNQLLATA